MQGVQSWDFPRTTEEESSLSRPVTVFGPRIQELGCSLSLQPSAAWLKRGVFTSVDFLSAKPLAREHLLVIISLNHLLVGYYRNVLCMGDLAKSCVLVPPSMDIATKIVQLFDSYTYTKDWKGKSMNRTKSKFNSPNILSLNSL